MIKILVVSPYEKDANSFWRCVGPLSYLVKSSGHEIETHMASENSVTWAEVMKFDLVFMHRPCRQEDLTILKIARNCGVAVWVDYDDWLFDLPFWNPHKAFYDNQGVQMVMAHVIACADVVSVTTTALQEQLKKINPNVVLLPNAYRSDLFPFRKEPAPSRQQLIAWRGGSATHEADLLSVKEGFKGLKAPVHFLGNISWHLLVEMNPGSYQTLSSQDVLLYFKFIYELKPKVLVFPLVDCLFNRCKSNIAYIEGIHAGALIVAPDLPEWRRPGVLTYPAHHAEAFKDCVNSLLDLDRDTFLEQQSLAFTEMKSLYDIRVVNALRLQLVNAVLSPSFEHNKKDPFDQLIGMWALSQVKGLPKRVS